ncbi:MAG: hypothetical protein QOE36_830 [Gaiellaceae bacterium]|nr:hypothetical protein [Gaiellaceae bacterium]
MTRLTAIVPATNEPPTLARCLAAIRGSDEAPEELVVVEEPSGAGPAAARNAGAARASGDVLVFVDADVVVHPEAFARIRAAFAGDPHLDAVFGSYDDDPEADGVVSSFRNLLHHHVHQSSAGPASTFWAGLGAVRAEPFSRAGGFDAERFAAPSVEDIDLGLRLSAAGARIRLDPSVLGKHLKAWSLRDMVLTDVTRRGAPWVALLLRDGGAGSRSALNLGWRHRLSAAAALAGTAGALTGRRRVAAGSFAALLVLNADFYALLARRRGAPTALAGVGLHVVHHLASAASVPVGVISYLRERAGS